jgi:dTDP-4-dehydrorhamnose reductase
MLKLSREREHLKVVSDQLGSPTWSVDLARAISVILSKVEAVRSGKEDVKIWGTYGYSNRGVASWYDLATAAIKEARATALGVGIICKSIEPIPTAEYPTPATRPAYSVLDTKKIERVFGVAVPEWKESLREMIKEVVKIEAEHRQTEVKSDA